MLRLLSLVLALLGAALIAGAVGVTAVIVLGVAWCLFEFSGRYIDPSVPTPSVLWRVWLTPTSFIDTEDLHMRISTEQKIKVTIAPKTAAGNDAPIDGAVAFSVDDDSVARIERIDDTSAYIVGVAPGAVLVRASFDADLGEGVREIVATGALEVAAAEAETAEIVFGEPEPQ